MNEMNEQMNRMEWTNEIVWMKEWDGMNEINWY